MRLAARRVIRSMRQLAALNYFNQEKLQPEVNPVPDVTDVDITYNVEEKSSDTFNASIGYGGTLGFTGSVGVSLILILPIHVWRWWGSSVRFGNGRKAVGLQIDLALNFSEPWLNQHPTSLGFQVYASSSAYIYTSEQEGASLSIGRRFKWPDDFFRADWTLSGLRSDITNGGGVYATGIHDETAIQQSYFTHLDRQPDLSGRRLGVCLPAACCLSANRFDCSEPARELLSQWLDDEVLHAASRCWAAA